MLAEVSAGGYIVKILVISVGAMVAVGVLLFGLHGASFETVAAYHVVNPVVSVVVKQPATPEPTLVPAPAPALSPKMYRVDDHFSDRLTETQRDIFRRASNAYARGSISDALREYMALRVELGEPSALVENRLGVVYHTLGNHSFAAHQFTLAIAAGDNHISRWNRAKANLDSRSCKNAVEDAEWLLENEDLKIHQAAATWLGVGLQATTHMGAHFVMAECHAPDRAAAWWSGEQLGEDGEVAEPVRVSPCHSAFHSWVRNASAMRVNPSHEFGGLRISPRRPCMNQWSSKERKATFEEHARKGLSMAHAAGMKECPACPFLRRYFQDAQAAGMKLEISKPPPVVPVPSCELDKLDLDEEEDDATYARLLGERPLVRASVDVSEYYACLRATQNR